MHVALDTGHGRRSYRDEVDDAAITVEQLPSTTRPVDKAISDKRGLLSWAYEVAPHKSTRSISAI
jgi:hypothetical protein